MTNRRAEYKQLLADARAQDPPWRVEEPTGGGYPRILCPCPEQHQTWVHLTPNQNYYRNKRVELKNRTCWKEPK